MIGLAALVGVFTPPVVPAAETLVSVLLSGLLTGEGWNLSMSLLRVSSQW